jgi:DNA-binding PucR family transcriptional regulator
MAGWWRDLGDDDVLVATTEPRVPLTIDARATAQLGPGALRWAHALAADLSREYVERTIPQLRQTADFSLDLLASAEANILTMLLALDTGEATTLAPPEAIAYAREAAARRAPLSAVLRGYRLGVEHWLRWCTPVIEARLAAADQADELQRAAQVAIRYGDHLSERVAAEYERELQGQALAGVAHRSELVRALLAGEPVELERASTSLGYPLRGRHLAVALSLDRPSERALPMLEAEVRALAGRVGASAQLTIPSGLTSVHAWLALARTTWTLGAPAQDGILVGLGTAGESIEGFRHSHTQAKRALDVARLARTGRFGPVVRYEQVRLLDVLSQDMSLARDFVIAELGGLASTDARAQELRTTLLEFLAANRSYQAVARSSHLHKNTVVKRVARAEQLIGAPISDRQLEVQTALQLADVFDDRLLTATISSRRTA